MLRRRSSKVRGCAAGFCGLLLLGAGCGERPADTRYFEERPGGEDSPDALMASMQQLNSIDGAIELVQASPGPDATEDDPQTVADWVAEQRSELVGDVMFPKWEGRRLGAHRFEVRYTHTVIDPDYNIQKSGYAWEVDTMVKVVRGPTDLEPTALEPRAPASRAPGLLDGEAGQDLSLE
jgi:hypothetical protein